MKELPGDTGLVSKGQMWLCHHADWLTYTLPGCGYISVVICYRKKWELPLGCPYSALGAIHWQVSLYPSRSRRRSPSPPQPWWKSHCSMSQSAEQFLLSLTSPNAHWGSAAGSGPSWAMWHISAYKWFFSNPPLTKLCERAVANRNIH